MTITKHKSCQIELQPFARRTDERGSCGVKKAGVQISGVQQSGLFLSRQLKFSSTPTVASSTFFFTSTEARWLIRDGDVGGGGRGGDERVKARPRIPPEKDRRDRGPPPEQWQC